MKTSLIRIYTEDLQRVKQAMTKRNGSNEMKFTLADSLHFIIERSARVDAMVTFYEMEIAKMRRLVNSQKKSVNTKEVRL